MFKRISTTLLAIMFLTLLSPIVAPQTLEDGEAVANKTTICHRTKSVKNPYRKISVSQGAVASGHSGHEGGLWTTSSVQGDEWGDIIPDAASGGPNNKEKNWTEAGIAIYRGQTLNPATGSPVCKVMSFKQYIDSEIAAAGGSFTPEQEAEFLNDIKTAKADEDLTLLNSIGLTFNTLTAANFTAMAVASEAIVVTTKVATLVTTTSANLNGSVKTDNTALNCQFEYDDNSSLVSPETKPVAAVAATLNSTLQIEEAIAGLTPGTKYFYRLFCRQSGDAYLYGETFFFTAGTAYSVTYDSNTATSGEVPSDSSLYAASESVVVRGNAGVLVKTGSTFAGWTLNDAGTGEVYSPNHTTTLTMPTANITLFAKWTIDTYTITYSGNTNTGGSAPSAQTKTYNVTLTPLSGVGTLVKEGHTFNGWNTASGGGGTPYAAGADYVANAAATLHAQWTPNTYTITYDGNGSTGGTVPGNQTKTYNVSLTLSGNTGTLTKGTDTFSGWNTAADGTGTPYAAGGSYTANEGATLFAKWTSASNNNSGNSGATSANTSNPAAIRKRANVSLVTTATTPVKSTAIVEPVATSAPGNSGNTPATPGNTPSVPDNSGGGATSPNQSESNPQRVNENNLKLSETTLIPTEGFKEISFSSRNLEKVIVIDNEVSVQAKRNYSGRTQVVITVLNEEDEITEITANVVVLPLQVTRQSLRALSGGSTRVTWERSANAVEYEVTYQGQVLCKVRTSLCILPREIPNGESVQITSLGRDNTESLPAVARFNQVTSGAPANPDNIPAPAEPATTPDAPITPAEVPAPIARVEGLGIIPITVTENAAQTGLDIKGADWSIAIDSTKKLVQGTTEDSSSRVVIEKGNTVTTNGTGFKPNTQVDVWVYSTPIWLGAVMTDDQGNFVTTLPMPVALAEGDHTFQAKGQTPEGTIRSASVPITLIPAVADEGGRLRFEVYFGMNSVVITSAQRARINAQVKRALLAAAKDAKFSIEVVGWVQPNPNPGNIAYLSKFRANNVATEMKKLRLKGRYSLNYAGLGRDNEPKMRHASVIIVWNKSRAIAPSA